MMMEDEIMNLGRSTWIRIFGIMALTTLFGFLTWLQIVRIQKESYWIIFRVWFIPIPVIIITALLTLFGIFFLIVSILTICDLVLFEKGLLNNRLIKRSIAGLKNKDAQIRRYSAEILGNIDTGRDMRIFLGMPLREALKDQIDLRAVDPLIETLNDETDFVANRAARALGNIGDPKSIEPLIKATKDERGYVRGGAAEALGNIGDEKALEPLKRLLKDEDEYARRMAAEAMRKFEDSSKHK
jgi:hypothetical protein